MKEKAEGCRKEGENEVKGYKREVKGIKERKNVRRKEGKT